MTANNQLINDSRVLNTPATRQLRRIVERIAVHDDDIRTAILDVLAGDEHALLRLVRSAQAGNQNSALAAIAALLPRMTGTIVTTIPDQTRRRQAVEEYISLAFLVIHDIDQRETPAHLANKIVARTRHRYERHLRALNPTWVQPALTVDTPTSSSRTEDEAISRLDLAHLADAVNNGVVSDDNWELVTAAGLGLINGPLDARQRQTVLRTRRRLSDWHAVADAA